MKKIIFFIFIILIVSCTKKSLKIDPKDYLPNEKIGTTYIYNMVDIYGFENEFQNRIITEKNNNCVKYKIEQKYNDKIVEGTDILCFSKDSLYKIDPLRREKITLLSTKQKTWKGEYTYTYKSKNPVQMECEILSISMQKILNKEVKTVKIKCDNIAYVYAKNIGLLSIGKINTKEDIKLAKIIQPQ